MSKFWGFVALIIILGISLLALGDEETGIHFSDLETECRYVDHPDTRMDFTRDNTVIFRGNFPFDNVKADLGYEYAQTHDRVVLDITAENGDRPETFQDTCLGQVVYIAETDPLPEGRYLLQLYHNGEKVEEKIVRTR